VSVKDLMGRDRHKKIAGARRCAMRAVRAMDPVPSLTTIGRWFGLHHTTVLHACRQ
jgi:chromosomal replication initiation ATPase DnaA